MLPQKRNWIFKLTWPITHYLVTHICVTAGYLFFRFLSRTTVIGRKNVPNKANTLLLSNHQSMIDSFFIGIFAFYPQSFIRPFLIPWNPAAEENFYRNPIFAWLADNWKCIRVKRGRKDLGAIFRMAEALKSSPMTLFPEGTRSRDGVIGRARGGAGLLIIETHPNVVPVFIDGMDKLLPIGSVFPRFFKKIYIYYGEPLDLSHYYLKDKSKEMVQAMMDGVMDHIRQMGSEIEQMKVAK